MICIKLCGKVLVLPYILKRLIPTLSDLLSVIGIPSSGFLYKIVFESGIKQRSCIGNTCSEHEIKLTLSERRCNLILHDLHPDPVSCHLI